MRFLTWNRRRARLVLLGALLVVWGCVLWSTGWTVSDLLDARAASVGSAASPGTQAAGSAAREPASPR